MSAHTPGPWRWESGPYEDCLLVSADGVEIISANGLDGKVEDDDLIAAAPELLDAARTVLALSPDDSSTDWNVALRELHSAVAKATGSA